jgi:hypothetical protein
MKRGCDCGACSHSSPALVPRTFLPVVQSLVYAKLMWRSISQSRLSYFLKGLVSNVSELDHAELRQLFLAFQVESLSALQVGVSVDNS